MFGALANRDMTVEEGGTYFRSGAGSCSEQAYVLEITRDKMGIPHVRYTLQVRRGSAMQVVENRTLALEAFFARYKKV